MKKILLIFALAAFTTGFAQENKNKTSETVVTKTITTDSKGSDVKTQAVKETKEQVIALDASEANQTNQAIVMKPAEVDTEVTYGYDGNRFKFLSQKDEKGYRMMTVKDNKTQEEFAIVKPSTQNGYYILSQKGESSFGYFNADGNFVVERYDPKTDAIVSEIYRLQMNK
ncbi:MAG TPA: hypothetical protein VKX40_06325 [Aequorivita sp.]|nr:hypothetical protein [Aequorivita sp.]